MKPAKPVSTTPIARRDFLRLSGLASAGLMLGCYLRAAGDAWAVEVRAGAEPAADGAQLNAFVRIAPDGHVHIASAIFGRDRDFFN